VRIDCGGRALDLTRPVVMGVLNVTPDSFSDGMRFIDPADAVAHAHRLIAAGAAIVDIGAESTRPGAKSVPADEQLRRLRPVLESLRAAPVVVSVDTSDASVMSEAVALGARFLNDTRGFREPGALDAAARSGAALCIMHMQGEPATMQTAPCYDDVVAHVRQFLAGRLEAVERAGVRPDRLVVDPGFGFGKTLAHNVALLRRLPEIAALGRPVLVGLSRKSMIGSVTGRSVGDRLAGSVALAALAAWQGAHIVRAHDVAETLDAVRIAWAVREEAVT
jgi:dihydropteroate synthase